MSVVNQTLWWLIRISSYIEQVFLCYCCFNLHNWPAMLSQSLCSKRKSLDYFQFTDQNGNHRLWFFSSWASIHGLWAFLFGFNGECWMWKNSLYDINLPDASTREHNPNCFLALQSWNNVVTVRNNIVTTLQPCVALKIVGANRLV